MSMWGLMPGEDAFADRRDAGRQLAKQLKHLAKYEPIVLGLPRGGVPVAFEVAKALHAPLDVVLVRKLGAPGNPELGLGAIVDGDHPQRFLNEGMLDLVDPDGSWLKEEERKQLAIIEDRKKRWRSHRPGEPLTGRVVILVDDGIATGGTVSAAITALRQAAVARIVLAVPVAPMDVLLRVPIDEEDFICLLQPEDLMAVGLYYADFTQTTDDEVVALLDEAHAWLPPSSR